MNNSAKLKLYSPYGFWGVTVSICFGEFRLSVCHDNQSNWEVWTKMVCLVENHSRKNFVKRLSKYLQWDSNKCQFFLTPTCHGNQSFYYTPPHKKWRDIMLYPPKILKFWVSVRSSVSASFPDSNLSSFWAIFFFKLCMAIDIGEGWFGIANWLNSFINNRVMVLDWCKNVFSSISSEQMDEFWYNFVYALINTRSMLCLIHIIFCQSSFYRVMALDRH